MTEPLLQTNGLCKTYRSGESTVRAVSDISLWIEQSDFVAIRGRSGSGKSTLMHLLGLLERPDAGQYRLRGRHVETLDEHTRAAARNREIGFVFQAPALLPRASALENVALPLIYAGAGAAERRRRAAHALDRVGLAHRMHHRPHQLSGGEQQRVVIARAIVTAPVLILADEPTGALDSETGGTILSLFDDLSSEGRTIVVVTHDAEVAARARRCITLHDGRIVTDEAVAGRPQSARGRLYRMPAL